MIKTKNIEGTLLNMGFGNPSLSVFKGFIVPTFQQKGIMAYDIIFTGKNPNWTEPVLVPEVKADEAKGIRFQAEYLRECGAHPTSEYKIHNVCSGFECDHKGDVLTACHEHALTVLGSDWEIDL